MGVAAVPATAVEPLAGPGIPSVVPAVSTFTPQAGKPFTLTPKTRIIVADGLTEDAQLLARELVDLDNKHNLGLDHLPQVLAGIQPAAGDIVLTTGEVPRTKSPEAYQLKVDGLITITGRTPAGTFYGTRTLLQSLVAAKGVEAGTVVDEPTSAIRSLHVDAARKYFSVDWFKEQFRQMAWVKLNQLQYHFSENEGFRLESKTHPEIVSKEHITQAQLKELIVYAKQYHIEIVPALDVPGHMRQALDAHPQWRASDTAEGKKILDYSNPEARAFIFELIGELAPLFPSKAWHLGGDEVFALEGSTEARFPKLYDYAKQNVGNSAKVLDGYVYFLNTVDKRLRELGKTRVRAWNDALYTPGTTEALNPQVDITYWTRWHQSFPTVVKIQQQGHKLINMNDSMFYYVVTRPGWAYSTKPKADKIYNEWTPGVFPWADKVTEQAIADNDPSLLGASFAIWCDFPEMETERQVSDGIKLPLRAMATKSWNPGDIGGYSRWEAKAKRVGDAPVPVTVPSLSATNSVTPAKLVSKGTKQTWTTTVVPATEAKDLTVAVDFTDAAQVVTLAKEVTTELRNTKGEVVTAVSPASVDGAKVAWKGTVPAGYRLTITRTSTITDNAGNKPANRHSAPAAEVTFASTATFGVGVFHNLAEVRAEATLAPTPSPTPTVTPSGPPTSTPTHPADKPGQLPRTGS